MFYERKQHMNGKENEYEFVKNLNNKKIKYLNPLLYSLLKYLFPNESEEAIIKCWLNHYPQKTDVLIKVNSHIRGISLKIGNKNSIHVEHITEFIQFLTENNVSQESIIEYLKYHYADGTTNGSGIKRIGVVDYKKEHQKEIDKINQELNNIELLKNAINRFVLQGNNSDFKIDAIVYGSVNDFLWLSKEDILDVLLRKRNNYSTGVHFSNLFVQPQNRCLNYNPKYENTRNNVQIKWYGLFDDIMENLYYKNNTKFSFPTDNVD